MLQATKEISKEKLSVAKLNQIEKSENLPGAKTAVKKFDVQPVVYK